MPNFTLPRTRLNGEVFLAREHICLHIGVIVKRAVKGEKGLLPLFFFLRYGARELYYGGVLTTVARNLLPTMNTITLTITRYKGSRNWAVYADNELLSLTVYLKGARKLCEFISQNSKEEVHIVEVMSAAPRRCGFSYHSTRVARREVALCEPLPARHNEPAEEACAEMCAADGDIPFTSSAGR